MWRASALAAEGSFSVAVVHMASAPVARRDVVVVVITTVVLLARVIMRPCACHG